MPRKQNIIVFPHLNNQHGNLKKEWYVEWSYRIPGESDIRRQRWYKGLKTGTAKQRYKIAEKVIQEKTEWLKSGAYLTGREDRVCADEFIYRHEARTYNEIQNNVVSIRSNLNEYMLNIKERVNAKTYMNYQSKMRIFLAYIDSNKLGNLALKNITREHILDFALKLSNDGLSRLTIKKYIQVLHNYFDYELLSGNIQNNPAIKIPAYGKIVDMAATPFYSDERKKLKAAIEAVDPQLWLACEIQYYCAIRPGTELRLMKIGWIDFERKKLKIPVEESKSNRADIVDIPDFLFKEFEFMKNYNKNLFVFGKFGRPGTECLGKNTMRNRFNRFREALGISADRKFYSWKHTGAIQLLDNGLQPIDLQTHLRHKSFSTTETYIKKRSGKTDGHVNRFSSEI